MIAFSFKLWFYGTGINGNVGVNNNTEVSGLHEQ